MDSTQTVKLKKVKKTRVIPGFKLTLGITVTMLSLIVLIPLASVMVYSLKLSPAEFFELITKKNVIYAFATSIGCSFIAAVINVIFGVILAWTLVKYDFPGKRILDGFIELPFCLPTAVAGITLSKMYSDSGILGAPLAKLGIKVSYTHIGIIIALVFVGIPFVVRNVSNTSRAYAINSYRFWTCICKRYWRIWKCYIYIRQQCQRTYTGCFLCYYAEVELY